MKKRYYNSINILRIFFAVFIACFAHYVFLMSSELVTKEINDEMLDITYIGVEVFFCISGFFAYVSYANKIRESKTNMGLFMWGRVKRLYPAMILSVVLMAAAQWISYYMYNHYAILNYSDGRNTIEAFILSIFGVNCGWISNHDTLSINGATWYISILMICYLLFYVITKISKNSRILEYVLIIAMMGLGTILLVFNFQLPLLYLSNGRGYLDFFGGVLIAKVLNQFNDKKYKKVMIGIGIVLIVAYGILRYIFYSRNLWYFCSFLFNPGIMLIFLNVDALDRISNNALFKYLGKISFGIYLFNMPTFAWIALIDEMLGHEINFGNVLTWIIVATINILVAMAVDFVIDKISGAIRRKGVEKNA